MYKFNMALYFFEAGNLNGSNVDMCFDVVGLLFSGLSNLFKFLDRL